MKNIYLVCCFLVICVGQVKAIGSQYQDTWALVKKREADIWRENNCGCTASVHFTWFFLILIIGHDLLWHIFLTYFPLKKK